MRPLSAMRAEHITLLPWQHMASAVHTSGYLSLIIWETAHNMRSQLSRDAVVACSRLMSEKWTTASDLCHIRAPARFTESCRLSSHWRRFVGEGPVFNKILSWSHVSLVYCSKYDLSDNVTFSIWCSMVPVLTWSLVSAQLDKSEQI